MKNQALIIPLHSRWNRCGTESLRHNVTGNIDVKQSRQKASSIQQTILHNLAQDAWLGADNHGQCWISDVVRLTVDAVYTDGITADTFQPHVEVRLLGISPDDVVKRSTLGEDECHAPLVIPKQPDHRFAGAVISENLQRLDFRQFCQFVLRMLQFQFCQLVILGFQLPGQTVDVPLQGFARLPVPAYSRLVFFIIFLFVVLNRGGHSVDNR